MSATLAAVPDLVAIAAAMAERDRLRADARSAVTHANGIKAAWDEACGRAREAILRLDEAEDSVRKLTFNEGLGVYLDGGRR